MPSLRVALEADFKLGRTSVRVPAAHIQRITIVGLTRFLDDAKCGGLVYRGVPLALLVFVTTQDDVTLVTDQGQCNSFWPFSHQRFRDHVSPPRLYLTHCLRAAAVRGLLMTDPGRTRHLKDIAIPWRR